MTKVQLIDDIAHHISNCNECSRLRSITPYPMSHICFGNIFDAKFFMVGRNPGIECDWNKVEFTNFNEKYHELWWTCNIGKYLRNNLGDEFLKKYVFFTNICKCSSPENSNLTFEEKESCQSYLENQIIVMRPKIIVTLGSDAKQAVNLLNLKNIKICNLFHPAYFSHKNDPIAKEKQLKILQQIKSDFLNE